MPETPCPDPWINPDDGDGGDYDRALDAYDREHGADPGNASPDTSH